MTVNEMAGYDKASRSKGDSLTAKQMKLLSTTTAVIICYDNFQLGISLEDQRGGRSSAYFRGTHQVAHEIIPFSNEDFDAMYVPMPYIDQAIPSPWGILAYQEFYTSDPANDFFN